MLAHFDISAKHSSSKLHNIFFLADKEEMANIKNTVPMMEMIEMIPIMPMMAMVAIMAICWQ